MRRGEGAPPCGYANPFLYKRRTGNPSVAGSNILESSALLLHLLEVPSVAAHVVDVLLGVPVQLFLGLAGIGVAGGDVTRAALHDAVGHLASAGLLEGAHESGLIGEDPNGIPNNLLPYVARVAAGKLKELSVFGDDYDTPDGTGVRDYIHVVDLALGHLAALNYAETHTGAEAVNLGTGHGTSVLEIVAAFEKASGRPVPYKICDRRPGDIATCYADTAKAAELLGWHATRDIDDMCRDGWNFARNRY